jgi:hypothetical protein
VPALSVVRDLDQSVVLVVPVRLLPSLEPHAFMLLVVVVPVAQAVPVVAQ